MAIGKGLSTSQAEAHGSTRSDSHRDGWYVWATTWLLRLMGGSICLAFFPIFLPLSWMLALHEWLGLGSAPEQPIFEYLARSTSAMYFAHGCLVLITSFDVVRYLVFVRAIAWLNIFIGGVLLGTDLVAGMPNYWTSMEGPPIVVGGVLLMLLSAKIQQDRI